MNLDLALHDIVTGVVEAGHHHLIDSEKLALLNGENHVLEVGLGGRRGGSDVERSIGKSAVEVKVENSFPICSQILFGVGLAGVFAAAAALAIMLVAGPTGFIPTASA